MILLYMRQENKILIKLTPSNNWCKLAKNRKTTADL